MKGAQRKYKGKSSPRQIAHTKIDVDIVFNFSSFTFSYH